jgi:hypothetical protein
MNNPKVEIRYVDNSDTEGYLQIIVNGIIQPPIRLGFDPGNDARIHMGLGNLLAAVYQMGFRDGEQSGKEKVRELLEWAQS